MVLLAFLVGGCDRKSKIIGTLVLTETNTANLSFAVSSDSYPSRWLFFEPIEDGEKGIAAYHELVYSSRVSVTIRNSGTEPFNFEHLGNEHRLAVGGTATLPEIDFKDFRLKVAPNKAQSASVELRMEFDKAYRTTSWKLVAEWSDGP